jgi:3-aminobutyryl-CoA ammonia-lyase
MAERTDSDPRLGVTVTHRRYVPYAHAHYAGNLVDGAYSLGLFGDVATEVCIRTDGDEGLFASYSDVQFLSPVRAGDLLEVTAEVVRVGRRSRTLEFRAVVVGRGTPEVSDSAARILEQPLVATTATGIVVVPAGTGQ